MEYVNTKCTKSTVTKLALGIALAMPMTAVFAQSKPVNQELKLEEITVVARRVEENL